MARFFRRKGPDATAPSGEEERPAKKSHLGILSADTDEVPGQYHRCVLFDVSLSGFSRLCHPPFQRDQTQRTPRSTARSRAHILLFAPFTIWPAASQCLGHFAQLVQITQELTAPEEAHQGWKVHPRSAARGFGQRPA
jgi:hypothetical protein